MDAPRPPGIAWRHGARTRVPESPQPLEHPLIHTDKLTKTFVVKKETVEAVKGVDIDVAPGELVAFLGPNGAGKSTTLRMLTTLLKPTSGSATVAGLDVVADPAGVRARIGYIGQGNGGGHSYRVIDEMVMQGRFYGMNTTDARPGPRNC